MEQGARTEMHNAFMGYIDGEALTDIRFRRVYSVSPPANPTLKIGDYGAITDVTIKLSSTDLSISM